RQKSVFLCVSLTILVLNKQKVKAMNLPWHDIHVSYKKSTFFCYSAVVVRERKTWQEALEHCREHHHNLASVASDTEMLLIQKELKEDGTSARVWMGLRFLAGGWMWVDGQPLAYERCAAIRVTGETQSDVKVKEWEAHDCVERLHFICY
uniref:C-type lectin domain-containing protein n=1 Tax=Cyclopterus lumpus TaxID=8103 RepID=A0A8C2ZAU8_CYCLU